jgi:adenine/guanine/hypoxanthine permease
LGGVLGYISFLVELIPRAVLAPIMVFVALEITAQAFIYSPKNHIPAVAFAIFPSIARLVSIQLENPEIVPLANLQHLMTKAGAALPEVLVTIALGNGFILTAMLWGAFLVEMINRRLRICAIYLGILGALTFFGIIHSAVPGSDIYLPWSLDDNLRRIPYQFALAYFTAAGIVLLLSFTRAASQVVDENKDCG